MNEVVIVDTCVFLNVLDVPGFNQQRAEVLAEISRLVERQSVNLLLPFAAIVETGNHIAHLSSGGLRRKFAGLFTAQVSSALRGEAPWTPTRTVDLTDWAEWLSEFPDRAMTGFGLGDLSILKEWEAACARHPNYRVRVWTLDSHPTGLDRTASKLLS